MIAQTADDLKRVIRERAVAITVERGPMRLTQLLSEVSSEIFTGKHGAFDVPANNAMDNFSEIIEEAVQAGDIVELEYIHPETSYKISSWMFPKGTKLHRWRGETDS